MKIKEFFYSREFHKSINKFSSQEKRKITKRIDLFLTDPFHPTLKTHKLKGALSNYWSFSISYHWRILFEFINEETVDFLDVGTHEIYK